MHDWEKLEERVLFERVTFGGTVGSNHDIAEFAGISAQEASRWIRSYLAAQRAKDPRTLYILHRDGRTSRAVWSAGVRAQNVRSTSHTYFEDVEVKFKRALRPDLEHVARRNPRVARRCERIIEAVGEGALVVLRAAVDGIDDEDA